MMHAQAQAARDLIEALVAGGVREAVISPGSRNTPLVLAAHASTRLRCHVAIDERVAGFMALGMSRVHGHPPLLICTSGSALAHYLPAVLEATASRLPMIVLSAARPDELTDCGEPQALDQSQVLQPSTRWFRQLPIADEQGAPVWAVAGAEALSACWGSPEGVVHLNCPFREPLWAPGIETQARSVPSILPSLPVPDIQVLKGRVEGWSGQKGFILCGPMHGNSADDERRGEAVSRFAEVMGWPVFAEPASRLTGRCGDVMAGSLDRLVAIGALKDREPDVLIQMGAGPTSKRVRQWIANLDCEHIVLDRDGLWRDPSMRAQTLIAGDEVTTLDHWSEQLHGSLRGPREDFWAQSVDALGSSLSVQGWSESGVMRAVMKHFDALYVASSLPIRHVEGWIPTDEHPSVILSNRGLNGIDGTLATALGASKVLDQPLLAVVGDVAFVHDLGALAQVVAEQSDFAIVVIDNGGGGIFRRLPIAKHPQVFDRYFETAPAIDVLDAARGLGLRAVRVANQDELDAALPEFVAATTPRVLIASVDEQDDRQWRETSERVFARLLQENGL